MRSLPGTRTVVCLTRLKYKLQFVSAMQKYKCTREGVFNRGETATLADRHILRRAAIYYYSICLQTLCSIFSYHLSRSLECNEAQLLVTCKLGSSSLHVTSGSIPIAKCINSALVLTVIYSDLSTVGQNEI